MVLDSGTKDAIASSQHEVDRGMQGSVHEVAERVAIAVDVLRGESVSGSAYDAREGGDHF